MAGINLETAQTHLNAWLEAELAVSTGQEYRIGSRTLRRANLDDIQKQINYWRRVISDLTPKRRVYNVIPRDW
jgi:hypothetical protein